MNLSDLLTGNARQLFTNPDFSSALQRFAADNPYGLKIKSLDRDEVQQAKLWKDAVAKYGSEAAARKWVAPPGRSNHNKGMAADLMYPTPESLSWAHANADKYGLRFPLPNENWHVEPLAAREAAAANPVLPTPVSQGPVAMQPQGMTLNSAPAAAPAEPSMMDKMKEGIASEKFGKGLETLAAGLGGGGGDPNATKLDPSSAGPGTDAQLSAIRAQAGPLLQAMMQRRRGLTLGMGGM